jgi:hypothetical protein
MTDRNGDLATLYQSLSDEALIERAASGDLTEEAQAMAMAELSARALVLPTPTNVENAAPQPYQGDQTIVAKNLSATEAHILCACLRAAGIAAQTADTNLVQTHNLLAIAVGGASVRVAANDVVQAHAVIAAFDRGEYALDDDFNVGDATP